MKTLTALKREATNFKWSMFRTNSFFIPEIPEFLKAYRKVTRVQADRIAFSPLNRITLSLRKITVRSFNTTY